MRQCNDPRVMEFFPKTLTKEEAREMINRLKQHIAAKGYGFWAVDIKTTGEFIGFVGLETPRFEADFTPCVEIGGDWLTSTGIRVMPKKLLESAWNLALTI